MFTYFTKNDEEFVFNPKDINGANQFLKSGINRLSISTKTLTDVKDSINIIKKIRREWNRPKTEEWE